MRINKNRWESIKKKIIKMKLKLRKKIKSFLNFSFYIFVGKRKRKVAEVFEKENSIESRFLIFDF